MAFYPRSIEIEGILYKQISPNQWQVVNTGQIIDNTRMVVIINEFKKKKAAPITPTEGPTGACCTIPNQANGQFVCQNIREEGCGGGCFTVGGNCNRTEEQGPFCDENCVRCCFIGNNYCVALKPFNCVSAGGTHFGTNGCTACKYGVCSSDQNNDTTNSTERFYGSRGCTGTFIVGGGVSDFRTGVFCTGSGVGQTCFGPGQRYQNLTSVFIEGGTCTDCIFGACCTGGTCAGITSQSACTNINGIFFAGQTCIRCDFGVYCTGAGNDRTCIRTGYRGEALSSEFIVGATCSRCIMGTCCVNQDRQVGVRQSECEGTFFANIFNQNACDAGSCCVGATCTENIFRYDCIGVFNAGLTCIACSDGACCLPGGGCTLTSMGTCMATGGTFFGGATCSACDSGACCGGNNQCTNQLRGQLCAGNFYKDVRCAETPCGLGACCQGNTCSFNIEFRECQILGGTFAAGFTCIGCATGAHCLSPADPFDFVDRDCELSYYARQQELDPGGNFFAGRTCNSCEIGACCETINAGSDSLIEIRGNCDLLGGNYTFFKGQTLFICATGVFCTGSNEGQTCFGLGYLGQSLTNNFIAGATCNACILGACCTGGTCLGGGLTSQAACSSAGGLFFAGRTCTVCDYGVYCTGATCLSLGYRGQSLSNNFILGATCSSCILGACCTGGTCSGGGQTSQAACNGLFYAGATCIACDYGVYCTGATCFELGYRAQALTNNFIQGATCNSCILGACCTGGTCLGGGQTSQAACLIAGGTFYVGATCFQCDTGVFCTGSNQGQTCFGLGHRGQSLTNNFIAGGTCSSCILGACCTGGSCLGGGLTSQAACSAVGGLFYAGTTCVSCDYGVYCTGSNETTSCLGLGYRAQNLSNQFVISGSCALDCVYGSCCQGTTCLGITNQGNCIKPNAFFAGMTCAACDTGTGACCTGGSSSITTITGCNALGGIFFPEGSTALCVTGSCCTGGTCTQEIVGRSGNCQLFIAGATCSICDTGVYCTGATCLQTGFRGQSLATVFILGETCSSCIQGICCKNDYQYTQIAGGKEHSVALTTYGEVRGFGGNTYGQSGMTLALGYTGIAAGFYHTLAISNGGTVMAWGRNQYGQSTVPAGLTGVVQVAAGEYHSIALRSNGGVTCWGWNGQAQCNVPSGLTGVTMISAGGGHNLALKQDGTVVAWGYNYDGQTNVPAGLTGVIQVAAGYHHSLALLTGGGITCWGMTLYGQCNIPAGLTASKIAAGGYHTLVLKADGGVTAFGRTGYDQTIVPSGLNAKQIAGGEFHSLAINSANTVVTWGSNIYGETNITSETCESFNQKQCQSKFGSFNPGATQCSVCEVRVNCCADGSHSYISPQNCIQVNGIAFTGPNDPSLCDVGAFCSETDNTCLGYTLKGYDLSNEFQQNQSCDSCIYGVCCGSEEAENEQDGLYVNRNECDGFTFIAGEIDTGICRNFYGICCTGGTCSEQRQELCDGLFVSRQQAIENNISCISGACDVGICCGESQVTSVTGGVCLGQMTRAECALTAGTFFPLSDGATCSNCLYIPMLTSVLLKKIYVYNAKNTTNQTEIFTGQESGFTGNEIQPRRLTGFSEQFNNGKYNTWITYRDIILWGGITANTNIIQYIRSTVSQMEMVYVNFTDKWGPGFTLWFLGKTLQTSNFSTTDPFGITGTYDYSPAFDAGVTSTKGGRTLGFIKGEVYQVPRYAKVVLGYDNTSDENYNKTLTYRNTGIDSGTITFSRVDATKHAQLNSSIYNIPPQKNPYVESTGDTDFTTPILLQTFAENPLKFRVRPVGSCCKGATCLGIITSDHCLFEGGTFYENSRCYECSPTLIFGTCCTGGTYYGYVNLATCQSLNGTFFRGNTAEAEKCVSGVICNANKQCVTSNGYAGDVSTVTGQYLVEGRTLCSDCDSGLCCKGSTCLGYIPTSECAATGGNNYYAYDTCNSYCDMGVCCTITGGCGFYTNRANCQGTNQVFVDGTTAGQTCSACSSLLIVNGDVAGVSLTYVFNKQTDYGKFFDNSVWVKATAGLKLKKIKIAYQDYRQTTTLNYAANTIVKGITTSFAPGLVKKGNYYVHGIWKNPKARRYYTLNGYQEVLKQPWMSISLDDYINDPAVNIYGFDYRKGSTDDPNAYNTFDLNLFMDYYNSLVLSDGVTLQENDVVYGSVTNFNPGRTGTLVFDHGEGYPYQVFKNRSEVLAYGVINCLGATQAALAGSTLCFRPPTSWPEEDIHNRPIHPVNRIEGKIPGQPGFTLFETTSSYQRYNVFKSYAAAPMQVSEFGDAIDYAAFAPYYSAFGYRTEFSYNNVEGDIISVYGSQFLEGLVALMTGMYTKYTPSNGVNYTQQQRKEALARIVQYGIDSYGAMKIFAGTLSSGAGQKPARTRPWSVIAGFYLGETAMTQPEETQLQDTVRTNYVLNDIWSSGNSNTPGGTCISQIDWRSMRWGGYTGSSANNFIVARRTLADYNSHEARTIIQLTNDPNNLVLHYNYPGHIYKINISGYPATGPKGISFSNMMGITLELLTTVTDKVVLYGNFARIIWGNTLSHPVNDNPFKYKNYKNGNSEAVYGTFRLFKVKCVSGVGAGATVYRILETKGSLHTDSSPTISNAQFGLPYQDGGWQWFLDRPWEGPLPNHESVLEVYPFDELDGGVTLPTSNPVGKTGALIYMVNSQPRGCNNQDESRLSTASPSPISRYFYNSAIAWIVPYAFIDHLERTTGVTLSSDVIRVIDIFNQYTYVSPYNIMGNASAANYSWPSNRWLGVDYRITGTQQVPRIDFARYFKGIIKYNGVTVQ